VATALKVCTDNGSVAGALTGTARPWHVRRPRGFRRGAKLRAGRAAPAESSGSAATPAGASTTLLRAGGLRSLRAPTPVQVTALRKARTVWSRVGEGASAWGLLHVAGGRCNCQSLSPKLVIFDRKKSLMIAPHPISLMGTQQWCDSQVPFRIFLEIPMLLPFCDEPRPRSGRSCVGCGGNRSRREWLNGALLPQDLSVSRTRC
jgi:hypothetical protein